MGLVKGAEIDGRRSLRRGSKTAIKRVKDIWRIRLSWIAIIRSGAKG